MGEVTSDDKTKPAERSDPLGVAFRQVGAIAGAIGVINTLRDLLELRLKWQHNIAVFLDAFRSFTRPIAMFLFGWIPAIFHVSFPGWAKDYLTVGVIAFLALLRAQFGNTSWQDSLNTFKRDGLGSLVVLVLLFSLVWPLGIILIGFILIWPKDESPNFRSDARIFGATFVYAAIIIIINYVFIAAGAKTE